MKQCQTPLVLLLTRLANVVVARPQASVTVSVTTRRPSSTPGLGDRRM